VGSQRKVPADGGGGEGVRLESYEEVRALLRSPDTRQGGFAVEQAETLPRKMRRPVLWRDGPEHRDDRRQTARFFTARRVESSYREMMASVADEQCALLRRVGRADVADLSFALAVAVAAEVVGLVPARPGMAKRLQRFFDDPRVDPDDKLRSLYARVRAAVSLAGFYLADVRPVVRARRRQRRDDLVSHLVDQGCTGGEILGECVTFGAAGMITTREFIVVAVWHLLTDDELRARWVAGDRAARTAILQEILRLEPVARTVYRVTTAEVRVGGRTIPAGTKVAASLTAANVDPAAVGPDPERVCPGRAVESALSFGDGPHRCPGAHVALQESEIFLSRLLALPGLRMAAPPAVRIRSEIEAYELSGLILTVDRAG
jgi:cytochrome P450